MKIEENGTTISITQTLITQFYDAKEKCLIDGLLKDMEENKEKYKGLTIIPVEREKIVELLNKGKKFDQLQQQLAEKNLENKKLKYMILELQAKEQDQRHQICEEIRRFIKMNYLACYKKASQEDVISVRANNDCLRTLERFLEQIEKGE